MSMPAAPDIYAVMEMRGHCTIPDIVEPMNKFANMHDRFRRRVVYGFGAFHAEVLDNFDVTLMMREVTLPGSDAQKAFNTFTSQVREGATCYRFAELLAVLRTTMDHCICSFIVMLLQFDLQITLNMLVWAFANFRWLVCMTVRKGIEWG